jgi:outer membrane protein assembly factor BamB
MLVLAWTAPAVAADWPQFLGPHRDGATPEKVAPWKDALKVAWHKPVGEGHGSPVVAGGKVFLQYKTAGKNEEVVAVFDAKSGELVFEQSYPRGPFNSPFGVGPRSTPTVIGDRLFTLGVTGILGCYSVRDKKPVWQVDTLKEFGAKNLFFGVSTSPLVEGDEVVVNVGGKGASVVAFDAATGKTLWKTGDDPASYSSPIVFGEGKDRQIVFLTGANLLSVSPAGKEFWKVPFKDRLNESSTTPVKVGDKLIGASVTAGGIGLKLVEKDSHPAAEELWRNKALTCYFSTPVPVDADHVYVVTGEAKFPGGSVGLHCAEVATGKIIWSKPKVGEYHAALTRTGDGKVLLLQDNGDLVLLEPSVKEYKELSRSKICGKTWAHPAVADGKLYIRDEKELICVELPQ